MALLLNFLLFLRLGTVPVEIGRFVLPVRNFLELNIFIHDEMQVGTVHDKVSNFIAAEALQSQLVVILADLHFIFHRLVETLDKYFTRSSKNSLLPIISKNSYFWSCKIELKSRLMIEQMFLLSLKNSTSPIMIGVLETLKLVLVRELKNFIFPWIRKHNLSSCLTIWSESSSSRIWSFWPSSSSLKEM